MFSFSLDRIKEIPDELKVIDTVIPPHFSEISESEQSNNKFLIAESNGIPEYAIINADNLTYASNQTFFFFDVETLGVSNPQELLKNKDENLLHSKFDLSSLFQRSYQKIMDYISGIDIKEMLRISLSDEGFEKLAEVDNNFRHIKTIKVNSLGKLVAVVNSNNKLMIVDLENKEGKIYDGLKLDPYYKHGNEIISIEWHNIKKDTLVVAYKNSLLFINNFNSKSEDLKLNSFQLSNIKKIKYSPSGEMLFVIHNKGKSFTILNSSLEILHNKYTPLSTFNDIVWAHDSSYYIIYTESTLYLYNILNLSEKVWKDFLGEISSVNISEDSNMLYVFTKDTQCPVYIIYNSKEDYSNPIQEKKFNNIPQYYVQNEFKTSYKLFSLWFAEENIVIKTKLNLSNNRLVVQYLNSKTNKTQLKIFEVRRNQSIHQTKMNLICAIKNFRDMDITDFEFFTDGHNDDVLLILWSDRILSKTYLNFSNKN